MLNFPSSPTIGQQHTVAGKSWEWTGAAWKSISTTIALVERAEDAAAEAVASAAAAAQVEANMSAISTSLADAHAQIDGFAAEDGAGKVGNGGESVKDSLDALQLPDYAALRAYSGPRKSVYVTGVLGAAAPSGIAGMLVRDDADTTTADNGGTVIVAAGGKRFKRAFNGAVDVRWFGAKGDGVAADSAAIQAAIDAHPGERVVGVAGQTYRLVQGLSITAANTVLDLNGTTLVADFASGWAVSVGDGGAAVGGLGVCNGRITTACTEPTLNGVRFRTNVRRRVRHERLHVTDFKGTGVLFETLNWSIQEGWAPLIERCGINLQIDDNGNAITITGIGLDAATTYNAVLKGTFSVTFVGGYIQAAGTAGVLVDSATTGSMQISTGISFFGTYLEANGVNHIDARNGRGLTVVGCYINGNTMSGPAIKLTNWDGAEIVGNTPANMTAGTARDFVQSDADCTLINVGRQAVTSVADCTVNLYGGSVAGVIGAGFNNVAALPAPSQQGRGSVLLYKPTSGTGTDRSRPYMCMETAAATRAWVRLATQPRKMTAGGVASPYTPNLGSLDTFDITVPNTGLTINAPTGPYEDGDRITFLLKQNSTGGGAVTWNAVFRTNYSNTGNTADKYASVEFVWAAGRGLWIQVASSPWL